MKTCAIICEYNPFHKGHEYHIEKTRKTTGADCIVALMSGSFTQRGDPAIFDKWTRAKCAIIGGADIVIELPFCFSAQSAEFFARGAVKMLTGTGCVDFISFGAESENISDIYDFIKNTETADIKEKLKIGKSYPAAIAQSSDNENMFTPNNILAAEYLKALEIYKSPISPVCIKRIGEGYSSENLNHDFISAMGCRKLIAENDIESLKSYVPEKTFEIIKECILNKKYADIEQLAPHILATVRLGGVKSETAYAGEGIENRILRAGKKAICVDELYKEIKTKRYTLARIKRIIINSLTNMTDKKLETFVLTGAKYLNVLASNKTGHAFLNNVKSNSDMQVISKISDFSKLSGVQKQISDVDFAAGELYSLCIKNPKYRTTLSDIRRGYIGDIK